MPTYTDNHHAYARQCMQGAVTLITMALPIVFSLLALTRVEHWRCTQHDKLHADRETVIQQTALLEEGQPLTISQDALQVRAKF